VLHELDEAWRAGHGASDRQLGYLLPEPGAIAPTDTTSLGKQTDTLVFACGFNPRASPGASPPAPDRRTVELSAEAVDGVPLGTPSDEAERLLRHTLGDADTQDPTDCHIDGTRWLTWGTFRVALSTDTAGKGVLRGWMLRRGLSRVAYALPYDVQPGDAMSAVLHRVPGATGQSTGDGGYTIRTDRAPDLSWSTSVDGAGGDVDTIAFRDTPCG
jgi:hypothetical protein